MDLCCKWGECVGGASLPRPDPAPVEIDAATDTTFLCESTIQLFYADVEPESAKRMERLLTRKSAKAMTDAVTYPAWQHLPTTYLMTQDDQFCFRIGRKGKSRRLGMLAPVSQLRALKQATVHS